MTDIEFYLKRNVPHQSAIMYRAKGGPQAHLEMNLFFLPQGGMTDGDHAIPIAEKVVEFLNSLPIEQRCLYPFTR